MDTQEALKISNGVKKITIVIIAIALVGAGLLLISQKLLKLTSREITEQQEKAPLLQETPISSEKIPFDTNDNLDQALQDLGQIEE